MDKDLASHVGKVAFRCAADLGDLIPILQDYCDADEYQEYSQIIAILTGEIGNKLLRRIYNECPGLEDEFDQKIEKFGVLL